MVENIIHVMIWYLFNSSELSWIAKRKNPLSKINNRQKTGKNYAREQQEEDEVSWSQIVNPRSSVLKVKKTKGSSYVKNSANSYKSQ